MASVSLNKEQILLVKQEAVRGKPYADRISIALAFRLLGLTAQSLDVFAVLDELDYLEGIDAHSKTKPESQFRRPPLASFWHKHFFSARNLATNVTTRWNMENGGNNDLQKLISEVAASHGNEPDAWPNQLVHRLIVEGFEDRFRRGLTGDWIVYAKHDGLNYYLDLATHQEGVGDAASLLYAKLKDGCHAEFPFLFEKIEC